VPDLDSLRKRLDALPVEPSQLLAGAVVVLVALVAGITWLVSGGERSPGGADPAAALPQAGATVDEGSRGDGPVPEPESGSGGPIVVHVSGAVVRPGLVHLPGTARVAQALEAAGGTTPDADLDRLNLAARIADGERLHVPRRGEVVHEELLPSGPGGAGSAATGAGSIVDLNRATVEQLEALPGIGPATAQAIVDHRARHGPFRSVAQLLQVRGIGEAKLAALRPRVRV
jgi:competence protein ComEA